MRRHFRIAATAATVGGAAWLLLPAATFAASGDPVKSISVSPWQALLIGFGYYLSNSPWLFGLAYYTLWRPLVAGLFVGLILGDPAQGALIGGAINVLYLASISAGGNLPFDQGLAGWAGTTIALVGGYDPATALTVAVPIGLLGTVVFNLRMTLDSIFVHWADGRADDADIAGVARMNVIPSQITLLILSIVPVYFLATAGATAVTDLLNRTPAWFLNGLSVAGLILPAIGIGLNMRFIFRGAPAAYFFLGYFMVVASAGKLSLTIVAIVGLVLAYLHLTFVTEGSVFQIGSREARSEAPEAQAAGEAVPSAGATPAGATPAGATPVPARSAAAGHGEPSPGPALAAAPAGAGVHLTRRDILTSWALWSFFSHSNYNFERLQGTGFAHAMTPIIRKLYRTEDEIRAALRRHLVFFNTEPNLGNVIHGTVIAMEEQRANGAAIDDDAINSVKSGLMGPLAGIGDTLGQGTLTPIFLAVGIGIAGVGAGGVATGTHGNPLGPIVYAVLISIAIVAIGYVAWTQGYARGRTFVTEILRSGAIQRVLVGASVLGNIVLGALAATTITVFLGPTINFNGLQLNLQTGFLDKILPGALPLAIVLLTWWLLRRVSPLVLLVAYLVASIVIAYPFFGAGPKNAYDYSYEACTSSLVVAYAPCTPPAAGGAPGAPSAAPSTAPSATPGVSPSASGS